MKDQNKRTVLDFSDFVKLKACDPSVAVSVFGVDSFDKGGKVGGLAEPSTFLFKTTGETLISREAYDRIAKTANLHVLMKTVPDRVRGKKDVPLFVPHLVPKPNLHELRARPIFEVGLHNGKPYNKSDIAEIVEAFWDLILEVHPIVKIGHDDRQEIAGTVEVGWNEDGSFVLPPDGMPSLGDIADIYLNEKDYVDDRTNEVKPAGTVIFGDYVNLPKNVKVALENGAYKRPSVELLKNYTSKRTGKRYKNVFRAVALLGETLEAVRTLDDVARLFTGTDITVDPVFSVSGKNAFHAVLVSCFKDGFSSEDQGMGFNANAGSTATKPNGNGSRANFEDPAMPGVPPTNQGTPEERLSVVEKNLGEVMGIVRAIAEKVGVEAPKAENATNPPAPVNPDGSKDMAGKSAATVTVQVPPQDVNKPNPAAMPQVQNPAALALPAQAVAAHSQIIVGDKIVKLPTSIVSKFANDPDAIAFFANVADRTEKAEREANSASVAARLLQTQEAERANFAEEESAKSFLDLHSSEKRMHVPPALKPLALSIHRTLRFADRAVGDRIAKFSDKATKRDLSAVQQFEEFVKRLPDFSKDTFSVDTEDVENDSSRKLSAKALVRKAEELATKNKTDKFSELAKIAAEISETDPDLYEELSREKMKD